MLDQLKKRGRHLANRCPLCGEDEETLDHTFLLCTKAQNYGHYFLLFLESPKLSIVLLKRRSLGGKVPAPEKRSRR